MCRFILLTVRPKQITLIGTATCYAMVQSYRIFVIIQHLVLCCCCCLQELSTSLYVVLLKYQSLYSSEFCIVSIVMLVSVPQIEMI